MSDVIVLLTANAILLMRDIHLSALSGPVPMETLQEHRCSPALNEVLFSLLLDDIEKAPPLVQVKKGEHVRLFFLANVKSFPASHQQNIFEFKHPN